MHDNGGFSINTEDLVLIKQRLEECLRAIDTIRENSHTIQMPAFEKQIEECGRHLEGAYGHLRMWWV